MKTSKLLALLSTLALSSTFAAETDPVGYVSVAVPANSDVALGAPLGRPTEFQGVIQSISGSTITVSGTPGWTANQFVYASGTQSKTYFLRVDSGSKEGLILPIVSNGVSELTVTIPAEENLTGINTVAADGSGEQVSIAPYWTVGTLFSGAIAGTQMLVTQGNVAGINLPSTTYTYNGTNWLRGATPANDDILLVGQGVTVRNNNTTTPLTLAITGAVPMTAHRMRLATLAGNTRQDIRIFYNSPVPEVIGNAFNANALLPGDQLLYVDNSASGKNKPATTLVWNGTNWLQGATPVTTTFTLQPGHSYIFRKNQTGGAPSSVTWSDLQSYLQ